MLEVIPNMPTNNLSLQLHCEEDQPLEPWVAKSNNIIPPPADNDPDIQYLLLLEAKSVDSIDEQVGRSVNDT